MDWTNETSELITAAAGVAAAVYLINLLAGVLANLVRRLFGG